MYAMRNLGSKEGVKSQINKLVSSGIAQIGLKSNDKMLVRVLNELALPLCPRRPSALLVSASVKPM